MKQFSTENIQQAPPVKIFHYRFEDDGTFPNSSLPVLIYKQALKLKDHQPAKVEELFRLNGWRNSWRDGIFSYHHYHSVTHEVLGIYQGKCELQLGGENGIPVVVEKDDVIIIPAGVAHKSNRNTKDFKCVGAYPGGHSFDINTGILGERPGTDRNIKQVTAPGCDPVFGQHGPMFTYWWSGMKNESYN